MRLTDELDSLHEARALAQGAGPAKKGVAKAALAPSRKRALSTEGSVQQG